MNPAASRLAALTKSTLFWPVTVLVQKDLVLEPWEE